MILCLGCERWKSTSRSFRSGKLNLYFSDSSLRYVLIFSPHHQEILGRLNGWIQLSLIHVSLAYLVCLRECNLHRLPFLLWKISSHLQPFHSWSLGSVALPLLCDRQHLSLLQTLHCTYLSGDLLWNKTEPLQITFARRSQKDATDLPWTLHLADQIFFSQFLDLQSHQQIRRVSGSVVTLAKI